MKEPKEYYRKKQLTYLLNLLPILRCSIGRHIGFTQRNDRRQSGLEAGVQKSKADEE